MENRIDWVRKLTSRKWWISVAAFIALIWNATGGSAEGAEQVVSLIMAGATVIGYTLAEGLADSAHKEPEV